MSELVERYKELSSQLAVLDADVERVKTEREGVCKQLLAKDGKGHVYDLGDEVPRVITTTKIGTHYMAPKNKWLKAGKPPKPPKAPRPARAAKPEKEAAGKPLVKRQIIGGKIVEMPVERRPSSVPPPQPPVAQSEAVATLVSTPEPVAEPVPVAVQKQPEPVERVEKPSAPAKPLDPLEAALAELDASDLE